jgi:hypothetical protein
MKVSTGDSYWTLPYLWNPQLLGDEVNDTVLRLQATSDAE